MSIWISSLRSNWHARISVKRLIVAAACSRPFVRAAVAAGFEVVAVDAFCDADTCRDATQAIQLSFVQGGFDAAEFRRRIFPLMTGSGFVLAYGSGFETQPELLEEIAGCCQLIGNDAETVGRAKNPAYFFSLLRSLDIPHPELARSPPSQADGWLAKRTGGSGGTHVQDDMVVARDYYYQRRLPGQSYSLLFLADGLQASAVGYNQQLLAPAKTMPYRYGGAVSHAALPRSVQDGMLDVAQRITQALGLRGLNSLDCMVDGTRFWVLEINPRLSATFALYDASNSGAQLLRAHLSACDGEMTVDLPAEPAQAHLIYYAPRDLLIPAGMAWPQWVADVPPEASRVQFDAPVCTIMATAASADAALELARSRVAELTQRLCGAE